MPRKKHVKQSRFAQQRQLLSRARTWSRVNLAYPLSYVGIMLALLFYAMSLTPSLLPRAWLFQGVASGLSLASGYALGALIMSIWRFLQLKELSGRNAHIAKVAAGLFVGWQVGFVILHTGTWQNHVRELVGMPPAESTHLIRVTLIALAIATLLLLIARLILYFTKLAINQFNKYVPRRVAVVLGVGITLWFFGSVVSGAFAKNAMQFASNVFSVADRNIKDGTVKPESPLRSGSPDSLVEWESLGRQGKSFVGTGPTQAELARFTEGAIEPIRVYSSLQNGDTHEKRAELALEELIRTNAFEREQLLIATTTGTGYLDPNAVDTFEYVHGGNTAIVGMQYSYLPSWISLISDGETAKEAGIALFNQVHGYWQQLDPESRPEVYLYGLSLGAYGSQASISRVEALNDPVDGALWVGPPFVSEFWNRITENRDPGSPEWLPVYQEGRVIRFTGADNALYDPPAKWQDNRIIYLQNATDPVVFFSTDYLWQAPGWLEGKRGPGVTDDMSFYPLVTFWQLAVDFLGAGSTPEDFGHLYSKSTYIESWAALTEPSGWSPEREAELKQLID